MKLTSSHDKLVLMFLNKEKVEAEALGAFDSHEKAAGRLSWFDRGV